MNKKMVAAAAFVVLAAGLLFLDNVSEFQRAAIVEEGSALMRVAALSGGEAVAARANARGVVRETAVAVGEQVKKGALVAKIRKE